MPLKCPMQLENDANYELDVIEAELRYEKKEPYRV